MRLFTYKLSLFCLTLLCAVSCGTFVGNPVQPDDDDDAVYVDIPELNLTVPSTATDYTEEASLNLADANLRGLKKFGGQIHRIIRRTGKVLDRVRNEDGIRKIGTYSNLGPNSKLSAKLESSSSEDYKYAATFCYENIPAIYVSWNSTNDLTVFYKGSVGILGLEPEEIISKVKVEEVEGSLLYHSNSSGKGLFQASSIELDYRSYVYAVKSDASLRISGVNSIDVNSSGSFSPYRLSIGDIDTSGNGSWAGWKMPLVDTSPCAETLNFESPSYCVGDSFTSAGSQSGALDAATIGGELVANGVSLPEASNLINVNFPESATCQ